MDILRTITFRARDLVLRKCEKGISQRLESEAVTGLVKSTGTVGPAREVLWQRGTGVQEGYGNEGSGSRNSAELHRTSRIQLSLNVQVLRWTSGVKSDYSDGVVNSLEFEII